MAAVGAAALAERCRCGRQTSRCDKDIESCRPAAGKIPRMTGACIFVRRAPPASVVEMDEDEGSRHARHDEGVSAAQRDVGHFANQGFALNPGWRKEPVLHRDPAGADGHAAGDETEELGEFATRDMFGLDAFNGKIHFGRRLFWEWACGIHSLSTTSSVAPLGIMMLTLVLTSCWPNRNVLTGELFGRLLLICSRVP